MSITVIPKAGEVFHGDDGTVSEVLPDNCDPNYEPSAEELEHYAEWLGIDPQKEREFMWIAREGLRTPLPDGWKACRTGDGEVYYFNFYTGESNWDHPMDEFFKNKLEGERAKLGSSARVKKQAKEVKGVMKRPLEKGSAGHVEDTKKSVLSSSASVFSAQPAPLPSGGRLGALGTPEATQRIVPDVRDIVPKKTEFGLSRRTLGSSGSPTSGMPVKMPEGVRELEAAIERRIDEEINAQHRAMQARHEKILADERATIESVKQRIQNEGEGLFPDGKSGQTFQEDLDAAQKEFEKQKAEIQARIKELEARLQREKNTLEAAFNRSIEEVRKEVQAERAASAKKQQEAAEAALAKANELSAVQLRETSQETEKLVEKAKKESEDEQAKRLEALSAELAKKLASAEKTAAAALAAALAAEEEAILRKITADAAIRLDAIRREYSEEEAKLRDAIKQAKDKSGPSESLASGSKSPTLSQEVRLTTSANETQRSAVEKGKAKYDTVPSAAPSSTSPGVAPVFPKEDEEEKEEQQRYEVAARQLDVKHTESMERIQSEHACLLLERDLFDPRAAPEFSDLLHAAQHAWLTENADSYDAMPHLERIPAAAVLSEEIERMHKDEAVRAATVSESQKEERRLEAIAKEYAAEVKAAATAHRTRRLQEVDAQLAQYRAEHQQRVLRAQQQLHHQQNEEDEDDEEEVEEVGLTTGKVVRGDRVTAAEAARREKELRAQLKGKIDALRSAVQQARDEQQQKHIELLHKQQQLKFPVPILKPPAAPASSFSTPLMNCTLSTIPQIQSAWSSARPTPMRPSLGRNPAVQSASPEVPLQPEQQPQQQPQQLQQTLQEAHVQEEQQQLKMQSAVYEDRLRRAAHVLRERRRELRERLQQMARAREAWINDMNSCRSHRDHHHVLLLHQIKHSLEKRAHALNREIIEMKRVSAFVREREQSFRRARSSGAGGGAAVEMLEDILVCTAQMESCIEAGRRKRSHKEHKTCRESSRRAQRARSLEKTRNRHNSQCSVHRARGDAAIFSSPVYADEPEGVTQWLMEQQFPI